MGFLQTVIPLIFLCVLVIAAGDKPDIYEEARNDAGNCKKRCSDEVSSDPLHLQGCERGCRFYAMGRIVHARSGGSIEENCLSACEKGFGKPNKEIALTACQNACKTQAKSDEKPELKEKDEADSSKEEEKNSFELPMEVPILQENSGLPGFPWSLFRSFMSMEPKFPEPSQLMKEIMEGEPHMGRMGQMGQMEHMGHMGHMEKAMEHMGQPVVGGSLRVILISSSDNQEKLAEPPLPMSKDDPWMDLNFFEDNVEGSENAEVSAPVAPEEHHPRHWFDCRGGIPRWLLLAAMFMCSLIFVWLCFSITGPRNHAARDADVLNVDVRTLTPLPLDKEAQLTLWETGLKDGGLPAVPLLYTPPPAPFKGSEEAPPPYSAV